MFRNFWLIGALCLSLASSVALAGDEKTSAEWMKEVAASMESSFKMPKGLTRAKVERPSITGTGFQKRLNTLTRQKVKDWKEHVLESGEFDHLSDEEREKAIKNPTRYLDVPYLLQIADDEIFAVYRDGRLVGYMIEASDHVQASIYQDGAWMNFYLDEKLNLVAEAENSA